VLGELLDKCFFSTEATRPEVLVVADQPAYSDAATA